MLKGTYTQFHDTPAGRDDYVNITESSVFPLFILCHTMGCQSTSCIWNNIVIRFWEKL